ncbi:DUF4190 domain-containing protein [Petralouisia muris]|jgi:hypothetical protein|uniref:DUF4190 domain-containing protein n=1 Tax=Petralouisia muris TaxID=3032872 RepID=A0AC61RXU8_9FIRM|nr:DUF4190 domain-containing protein [Petralouisia muris]TGY96669.1 DUF4190 domain-containing protein [Petralouisia muris]
MDYESNKSYIEMRSAGMSVAAMIMGILGLVMSCCVYPAIVFGSLAIIFALLSRGGEMHTNGYAKAGLILGIIGIVCGILFLMYSFFTLLVQFGGWEGYLNYIEELMQEMGYPDSVSPYDFYDTL